MKYLIKLLLSAIGAVNISYSGHTKEFYYTLDNMRQKARRNLIVYRNLCKKANVSPSKFWIDNFGGA